MILDLVKPSVGHISYKVDKFPDGQQQVTIIDGQPLFDVVTIKTRLNNFSDLELIICAVQSLKSCGVANINLYTPYFLGSRSDRQFESGSNNYLKHVICPIINSLGFSRVMVVDPHSYSLEMGLNNFYQDKLKQESFYNWVNDMMPAGNFYVIAPDAGAQKRVELAASCMSKAIGIITCSKIRTKDDVKNQVPLTKDDIRGNNFIIVDDICDGGKTFTGIAEILNEGGTNSVYLAVTHGIFSKGLKLLDECFDSVFCTNSYQDITSYTDFGMKNERYLNVLHQFNIF